MSKVRLWQLALQEQPKLSTRAIQVLEGYIDGKAVQIKPDTGAQANFMSLSFAKSLGLALNRQGPGTRIGFPMANGQSLWSIAQASARWRFKDEIYDSYELKFFVIANCVYDVIIGDDFLQSTQTMSVFRNRLSWVPRPRSALHVRHVNSLGNPSLRIRGKLNERSISALPDSGAEPNMISFDYAKRRGWLLHHLSGDRNLLQFPDGSLTETVGQVQLVWGFDRGEESYAKIPVVLEVVRELRFDVVLGQDFLEDTEAYTNHASCFHKASAKDHDLGFCLVIWYPGKPKKKAIGSGKCARNGPSKCY